MNKKLLCFYLSALEKVHNHYIYSYISHMICYPFSKEKVFLCRYQSILILVPRYSHIGTKLFSYWYQGILILVPRYSHIGTMVFSCRYQGILILVPWYSHVGTNHQNIFSHTVLFHQSSLATDFPSNHTLNISSLWKKDMDMKNCAVSLNTMISHTLTCS